MNGVYFRRSMSVMTFVLTICVSACDSGIYWEDDAYIVTWLDTFENVTVNRKLRDGASIERIGPQVVAVASDSQYLTAKVLPIGETIHVFYFLKKSLDNDFLNGDEIAVGPLSEKTFESKSKELNLPKPKEF